MILQGVLFVVNNWLSMNIVQLWSKVYILTMTKMRTMIKSPDKHQTELCEN